MSCTNPCLLEVVDTSKIFYGERERFQKLGFKFSKDFQKAYRFACNDSRRIPLEELEQWQTYDLIELPCGSCLSCRLDYSKDWAIRCQYEAQLWKDNYFVTLSYDDEHLPYGESGNPTLSKEHIMDFIKALRNYFNHRGHTGIRYLLCGEYNSSGERMLNPHYHLILFNCPIPDLTIDFPTPDGHVIHKFNKMGLPMFFSPLLNDIWSNGFIAIDDANYNTESYVSRYIMKKQKGKSSSVYNEAFGVIPPFIRMSNKPGIGFNYFLTQKDKLIIDPTIILPSNKKPIVSGIPKYFKRKLFEDMPKLRYKFMNDALKREYNSRTIRYCNQTTSNQQKAYKEDHIEKVTSIFSRDFE